MTTIPNEFTACESYRGWTIAVANGRYSIWNAAGHCRAGHCSTRATARQAIDQQLADAAA